MRLYFFIHNKMKKFLLSILVACASLGSFAQDKAAADTARAHRHHHHHRNGVVFEGNDKKPKVQLYGFVRNYFTYDSHTAQTVNGGLFLTLPNDENLNILGEDLNKQPSMQWMAFTTRLGLNLNGPRISENCMLSGKIEMDFCGYSTYTYLLRIRQAYAKMAWKQNMLTLGQAWHPMFNSDMMPGCIALATGSPFQPFNRSPQIRHDFNFGKRVNEETNKTEGYWRMSTALLWMLQYTPVGPDKDGFGAGTTANIKFENNSCIPELYYGLEHVGKKVTIGAGVDLTSLKPRQTRQEKIVLNSVDTVCTVKSSDRITSVSPVVYFQYKNDNKFKLMAKALIGNNTAHLNMPSGYGLSSVNEETGECEYTALGVFSSWINPTWTINSSKTGNVVKLSLFTGYQKNLGSKDPMIEEYVKYTSLQHKGGKTLDNCFRIAPAYIYSIKCLDLAIEYELTGATYGEEEKNQDGLFFGKVVDGTCNTVINNRICAMVKYNF